MRFDELNKYKNKFFKKQETLSYSQKQSQAKTSGSSSTQKTPKEVVFEIVKNNPGLTGQEIAKKAFQNYLITYNILIEKLKGRCYKDENYGWYLLTNNNEEDETDKSVNSKILKIIETSDGIKAKDIAKNLGLEKSTVNSILYGVLKKHCQVDDDFLWRLKRNDVEEATSKTLTQTNQELIVSAVQEHRAVSITYKGFSRTIHPYSVNNTYCVAYCTYRNDLRTFRLDRMKNIQLGEKFVINNDYIDKSGSQIEGAKNFRKYY